MNRTKVSFLSLLLILAVTGCAPYDRPEEAANPEDLQLAYEKVRESLRRQREAEETFWERLRASEY